MAAETSRRKHLRVADRSPEIGISESEAHPDEVHMTIRDVVEVWFSMNPEPKHFRVAGRTYADFVHSCCQFLLARAMRQGITSTDAIVGSEDRRHIEAFLGRGKALWDKRCQEEQAEVDARRRAKEKHQLEEKRQVEEPEIQRQARLLQEDNRRLEEAQKQAEAHRRSEEQRVAEVRCQWEAKQEALRQAELATHNNEQVRIDQVFFKHHQVVANEGIKLQAGQCSGIEYYAFVLRDRIERSAEILFDSASQPSHDILRKNPELLNRLKGLSFGDDRHPSCYQDPYVNAYYALRYELGYAFEYSQIYGLLLSVMRQEKESQPFDVISVGSGQGLDYWSLRYALARQREHRLRIGWHGIDSEIWPDHVLEDDVAQYSDGTDICDVLGGMDSLEAKVLMFPKVISELSGEVIRCIVSWLERVTFTRDVHYLCFAHTERKSLDPSGDKQKETGA